MTEELNRAENSLQEAEKLLARLEEQRARLEATDDPEGAIEVMQELAELAKQVEAAIEQARKDAGA